MAPETELVTKVRTMLRKRHGSDDHRSLRQAFETYDANGSGCLEADELAVMLADAGIGNKLTRGMWVRGILARLSRGADALSWDDLVAVLQPQAA